LLLRHFGAAALSLKVTRSFDAVRILVLAIMATLADCIIRKRACDIPSLFSLHYDGVSEGPTKPFGFDMGHFAVEGEVLRLVNPELCTALTQVLDYHHQLAKTIPATHKVFGFEHSMHFGEADEALMSQLCYNMAFPQQNLPQYWTGQDPSVLDVYPEIGLFRDVVFMFKYLMVPTSDALPDVKPWKVGHPLGPL
jgi:hypothetical protein